MRTRGKSILIRFTEDEFERLNQLIELSGITQQEFARSALMNKKIIVIEGFKEYTDELKRVGNNLNQLTRSVHQNDLKYLFEDFETLNKELKKTWLSLSDFLESIRQKKL